MEGCKSGKREAQGGRCRVSGHRYQGSGIRGGRRKAQGARHKEVGFRYQVIGIRGQVSGKIGASEDRYEVSGVRCQMKKARV